MGLCRYCNTKAGFFKHSHDLCSKKAEEAFSELRALVSAAIAGDTLAAELMKQVEAVSQRGQLNAASIQTNMLKNADDATRMLASENPVSVENADRIGDIFKAFDSTWFDDPSRLVNWDGYLTLLHSSTLYQVLHGEIPYCNPSLYHAFRLDQDEHPILKRGATLAEHRTISTRGAYQSVGIPLGGGIYYRVGASAPRTQHAGLVPIDQGTMLVSTRAVYFSGQETTFRIPYSSMLRVESFTDGVGIHENHGRGKTFIPYKLGNIEEGWYFYNLILALSTQNL